MLIMRENVVPAKVSQRKDGRYACVGACENAACFSCQKVLILFD